MLGEPVSMLVPQVVGFKLDGRLPEGATATDLVLTVTQMLRETGVVGKFVEYFGPGLAGLALADRATIGNMSPEYGATCGFFPVDEITIDYLRLTGRPDERIALVEAYCRENMLWHDPDEHPTYSRSSSSISATSSRASPARGVRRIECRSRMRRGRSSPRSRPSARATATARRTRPSPTRSPPATRRRSIARLDRGRGAGRGRAGRRDHGEADRARRGHARRRDLHARARLGRHRRDHELHEHVEPAGHARRRAPRQERGRARPDAQAVGEVEPGAGLEGRHRVLRAGRPDHRTSSSSASTPSATAARRASETPGRSPSRSPRRSARPTWWSAPCSRATATSRRASTER